MSGTKRNKESSQQSEMTWSEESLSLLIENVEKYKCLYDHSQAEYYNDEKVHTAWAKIGHKLGKRGSQVRTVWKQLNKTYTWLTKNDECKMDEECTWPHLERMGFLKPFLLDRTVMVDNSLGEDLIDFEATTETGVPVPVFIKYAKVGAENSEHENMENSLQMEDCVYSSNNLRQPPFPPPLNGMALQKSLEIEEALCQYLKKKVSKEKDPNELFLTSVAHDMKMLPIKEQAVFKMKVQQLLVEMISKCNSEVQ